MYKLKWFDNKRDPFLQNLNLVDNLSGIERAKSLVDVDVNEAIGAFTAALNNVASYLVKKQSGKKCF